MRDNTQLVKMAAISEDQKSNPARPKSRLFSHRNLLKPTRVLLNFNQPTFQNYRDNENGSVLKFKSQPMNLSFLAVGCKVAFLWSPLT